MVAITGANCKTGSVAVELFLARGQPVRAIGPLEDGLVRLRDRGAAIMAGDDSDEAFLTKAFQGADAVCLLNSELGSRGVRGDGGAKIATGTVNAIRNSGVGRVVLLSIPWPDTESGTVPAAGIGNIERKLSALENVDSLVIKADCVLEHVFAYRERLKNIRTAQAAQSSHFLIRIVTSQEIGAKVAEVFVPPLFSGHVVMNLSGRRWFSYPEGGINWEEVAATTGESIAISGKP